MEDTGSALFAEAHCSCLASLMCPFQSKRLCSPRCGVWEETGYWTRGCVFWRAAGTGGAVPTALCLLEEWVSLPCLSAYEEMDTEEPPLKTSLVVSELLWRRTQCSLYAVLEDS